MANNNIITIKQLSGRLEASSSSERVDALSELQTLSRSSPDLVGEYALPAVLQILRSQGTAEEYSEALDLLSRLINTKDRDIARANTARILGNEGNVELLLDLLEHSDLMVGVMTSQILTELHSNDGAGLEAQIQFCPDGMNKLLQRLPDNSREEVRNQAIVLVQQLTSQNEEMKKTVAFNEGFEILFRIINDEGGSGEAGLVVSDCLKICNNILLGSETCQRLFFGMGVEWILRLSDFFNPMILERMEIDQGALMGEESPIIGSWFLESNRLSCAVLALAILNSALSNANKKHQTVIVESAAQVLQSAIHWLARNGPKELVTASLCFLDAAVASNSTIAQSLATMLIKLAPNVKSRNVASDAEVASLTFAWRPLPSDERRCISLLLLLAERYISPAKPWKVISAGIIQGELGFSSEYVFNEAAEGAAMTPFLLLFSRILSTDTMVSDTLVQYVLAPPPPNAYGAEDEDDDVFQPMTVQLETLRPVCSILLQNMVQTCEKLMTGHFQYSGSMGSSQTAARGDLEYSERVAHVLTVVFMNGSLLARELSTAITTSHCLSSADGKLREVDADNKAVLPFILAAVGKAARLQGGLGYTLVKATLIWMSTVVCGCERAVRLVFEDPANLFVVDLATSSSEAAGVPTFVQVSACFFLGCAFLALPPDAEGGEKESNEGSSLLRRKTFLTVIDSRIGLNRFTEMLKRPLLGSRKATNSQDNFFLLPGLRIFYETHVEKIKDLIFEMYAGGGSNGTGGNIESIHLQKIAIQAAKIKELEKKMQQMSSMSSSHHTSNGHSNGEVVDSSELSRLREINAHVDILEAQLTEANAQVTRLQTQAEQAEMKIKQLTEENASILSDVRIQSEHWNTKEESFQAEILKLKEAVVSESDQRRAAQSQADQKEKKISLLESELTALRNNQAQSESSTILQLQSKLDALQTTLKTNENQLQDALHEKQELTKRFNEEHRQLIDFQARLSISEESNMSLQTQLDTAHAQLHEQETHVHGLERTNKELQRSIQVVREELASLHTSSSQLANEEVSKMVHQIAEYKSAIDQTLAAVEDFAECIDLDYKPYVGEDDEPMQKFVHTVDLIDKLRLAFTSVVAECSDLAESVRITDLAGPEGSLERNSDCCRRMAERLVAMEEVSVSLHELQQSMSQYEVKFREIEQEKGRLEEVALELTSANEDLTQQLAASTNEIQQARDEVSKEQNAVQAADARLQEASEEQEHLQKLLKEIENERDRFKTLHEQSTLHSTSHVNLLQATEQQLREQVASLESELQEGRVVVEGHQKSLLTLANTMREKDQSIELLRQELQGTKNSLQAKEEQVSQETERLKAFKESIDTANKEITVLNATIVDRNFTIAQLRTAVNDLEEDKHRMQQQLSEKVTALNELESRQANLSKQLSDLAALSHAKETQSTLSKESKDHLEVSLQSVRDQLKMAYDDMEAEKKETNNLLSALKTLQSTHQQELNELRQELVHSTVLIAELKQRVGVLDESVGEKLNIIHLKDEKIKSLGAELEQLHKQCKAHENEIVLLKDAAEKERAAAKSISETTTYSQAIQLQDIEIKRLSATVNGLSKELLQKEHELRNFYTQSARKEGEISSLKVEMEGLREQVSTLRAEALSYSQQLTEYERKLHDLTLQNQHLQNAQLEKVKMAATSKSLTDNNVLSNTERLQVTEAMYTLHSFVSKQSDKYSVDFLRLNEGQFFTTHDLATLVKAVKEALQQVLDKVENQVEGFSKLIEVKEKEISHLRSLQSSSSYTVMNTTISPIKGSHDANAFFQGGVGSAERSRASYVTPARPGRGITEPSSGGLWTGGRVQPSTGRRAVSVTPAAKETARLHLELARERKKLDELQEEHSDLLGMLAQQEVELSIFKKKLLLSLGPDKIATVEEEAKSSVERMYGTYTNFRPTDSSSV